MRRQECAQDLEEGSSLGGMPKRFLGKRTSEETGFHIWCGNAPLLSKTL